MYDVPMFLFSHCILLSIVISKKIKCVNTHMHAECLCMLACIYLYLVQSLYISAKTFPEMFDQRIMYRMLCHHLSHISHTSATTDGYFSVQRFNFKFGTLRHKLETKQSNGEAVAVLTLIVNFENQRFLLKKSVS